MRATCVYDVPSRISLTRCDDPVTLARQAEKVRLMNEGRRICIACLKAEGKKCPWGRKRKDAPAALAISRHPPARGDYSKESQGRSPAFRAASPSRISEGAGTSSGRASCRRRARARGTTAFCRLGAKSERSRARELAEAVEQKLINNGFYRLESPNPPEALISALPYAHMIRRR